MGKTVKADRNADLNVKAALKAKKAAVKAKLAQRKEAIKRRLAGSAVAVLCIVWIAGCAWERADPAARSNRADYKIVSEISNSTNVTNFVFVSDGLMATADGAGAITQPSTQTATQSPEVTMPADAVAAGVQAVGRIGAKMAESGAAGGKGSPAAAQPPCEGAACGDAPAAQGAK